MTANQIKDKFEKYGPIREVFEMEDGEDAKKFFVTFYRDKSGINAYEKLGTSFELDGTTINMSHVRN